MSACGSNNAISPPPPTNPTLTYYTLSSSGPTTINLPAYEGYTVTVTVPAVASGTGRVAFIEASVPPTGFPTLASSLSRAPQVKGAPRKTAATYPGIANTALFYIYMESDAPVTLSGYPGFKIQLPGSASTPPYYMAYIAPLPPPPTTYNLNIEGPGGTTSPLNFAATNGPAISMQQGNFYVYAPYVASGPALTALPSSVVFMEPNQSTTELLLDAAAVNLTSISSANTGVVSTSVATGRTDVAGHFTFTLTSGSSPSASTNVTARDENGGSTTIAVQNVVTNSGVTIPGLPQASQFTAGVSGPQGIAPGPDGNLWFLQTNGAVAQIQPDGTVSNMATAGNSVVGGHIAPGPDAAVWFSEPGAAVIARVSTAAGTTGALSEYNVATSNGPLTGPIAAGSDNNIWYAETTGVGVAALNGGATIAEYNLGAGHNVAGLAAGPDGNIWIADSQANAVIVMSTSGTVLHTYAIPTGGAGLAGIAAGADGRMWVAESAAGQLAAITTGGSIQEYYVAGTAPAVSVAAGPDGNIWFGANVSGDLGRITPAGVLTQFVTGTNGIAGIATGADGKLYFTEPTSNAIGRLSL